MSIYKAIYIEAPQPHHPGNSWMHPDPNMGPLWEIPILALYFVGIYGGKFPRIPKEHNKYYGYTVRGTPNCPLIQYPPVNQHSHRKYHLGW